MHPKTTNNASLSDPRQTCSPPVCDFCNAPPGGITRWYFAQPAALSFLGPAGATWLRLSADWCACAACADLIDADDRGGLLERACTAVHRAGLDAEFASNILAAMHRAFWAGKAVRK